MVKSCLNSLLIFWPTVCAVAGKPIELEVVLSWKAWFNEQHQTAFNANNRIDSVAQTMQPQCNWPDLNHADKTASRWQGSFHWDRMLFITLEFSAWNTQKIEVKL